MFRPNFYSFEHNMKNIKFISKLKFLERFETLNKIVIKLSSSCVDVVE